MIGCELATSAAPRTCAMSEDERSAGTAAAARLRTTNTRASRSRETARSVVNRRFGRSASDSVTTARPSKRPALANGSSNTACDAVVITRRQAGIRSVDRATRPTVGTLAPIVGRRRITERFVAVVALASCRLARRPPPGAAAADTTRVAMSWSRRRSDIQRHGGAAEAMSVSTSLLWRNVSAATCSPERRSTTSTASRMTTETRTWSCG